MLVYRITTEKYSKKLTASGAANRWNMDGELVIYAAESRSLASLELIVHRSSIKPKIKYKVLVIDIDIPKSQILDIKTEQLPLQWRSVNSYKILQRIGSEWYSNNQKLLLRIPSAVIPMENNYVINTKHKLFSTNVKIEAIEDYFWDERLL